MKPNFALDFRNDAITLLHRTPRGWHVVGTVGLDAADLAASLAYLRTTALELSPIGMTTKLVIPNSQILYTQVQTSAQDAGRRRKQVARALEGVTPYAVADLAFDIAGSGPTVDVAVIAKETLAEAEAFATEHKFNPVSFVAVPDTPGFTSEPWFGPTGCAASHLPEGQRVDRDPAPIVILGREVPVEAPAVPEPAAAPPAAIEPEPVIAEDIAPQPMDAAPAPVDLPPEPEAAVLADVPAPEPAPPEPVAPLTDLPQAAADAGLAQPDAALPEVVHDPVPAAEPEPEEVLAQFFETAMPPNLAPPSPAVTLSQDPAPAPVVEPPPTVFASPAAPPQAPPIDEAPIALDVVDDLPDDRDAIASRGTASVLDASIPDDVPPAPPTAMMVAFGSRRALEASAKEAAAKAGSVKVGGPRPAAAKPPVLGGISATRTGPQAKVTTLPPRTSQPSVVRLPQRPVVAASPAMDAAGEAARPAGKPAAKPSAAGKALRGLGALVTSPGIAGAKERRPVVQTTTPPTGPSSAASAAAATLTKAGTKPYSGGLGNRSMERAKPRYLGLILTGILLVFLVLVAAWSTLFLESRDTTTPDPNAVVDAAPPAPDAIAATDSSAVDPEMLADLQIPDTADTADIAPDAEADAVAAAVAEAVAEVPAEPAPAEPAPVEPAPATALDTQAAEAVPPEATPQDEFLLATTDEPPAMPDALSLPQPVARNDAPPGPAVPPPPFGTVYRFDADGLIVPTPDGILTPEGVLLFAGRPTREPPPRPASLVPATPEQAGLPSDSPALAAGAVAADGVTDGPAPVAAPAFADPALAGARPRQRPEGLTPPTQNADDDASLAPQADSRFASLRPRAKPAALVEAAAADPIADLGAQAASLTAQANATTASSSGSPLTLAVSRKPAPRPQDMSRAVEAAVAVASRQPDPAPPPVEEPAAKPEPTAKTEAEADDEPEIAKAMPRLPTSTSVAKQATYVNAINLSKVNLIGIYGSSSDRYALIRQPNGRYKKVKVGDSFDGGRVAAITTSEVRYQKSGKMVTLALPKG